MPALRIANLGRNTRERNTASARLKLSIRKAERRDRDEAQAQAWAEARRTHPPRISPQAGACNAKCCALGQVVNVLEGDIIIIRQWRSTTKVIKSTT